MQISDEDLNNTPIFRDLLRERTGTRVFLTSYQPTVLPVRPVERVWPKPADNDSTMGLTKLPEPPVQAVEVEATDEPDIIQVKSLASVRLREREAKSA